MISQPVCDQEVVQHFHLSSVLQTICLPTHGLI